jgi:hypothetical protein
MLLTLLREVGETACQGRSDIQVGDFSWGNCS